MKNNFKYKLSKTQLNSRKLSEFGGNLDSQSSPGKLMTPDFNSKLFKNDQQNNLRNYK